MRTRKAKKLDVNRIYHGNNAVVDPATGVVMTAGEAQEIDRQIRNEQKQA